MMRYETLIVAAIGVLALVISAYTAYVQRQQLRAAVWPILQYGTGNAPTIRFFLQNKGVGPAIIRHAVVRVSSEAVPDWREALQKLLGPGAHHYSHDQMKGRVLSAGESIDIFVPRNDNGAELTPEKNPDAWAKLNRDRNEVAIEVCYCSTLDECWTLHGDKNGSTSTPTRRCPERSATSFEE